MTAKEFFSVGVKLIGAYFLATGVCALPTLLNLLGLPDTWSAFRSFLVPMLSVALQLAVGWYFVRGAPRLMALADG